MFDTMQEVFDAAAAIEQEKPGAARLLVTHFEFTLSAVNADRLPNVAFMPQQDVPADVPKVIFEYIPPERHPADWVAARPNLTHYFQFMGVEGTKMPIQSNGALRIVRNAWRAYDKIEPEGLVKPGETYVTFEFLDIWGLRAALVPILLASDMREFPGIIERQTNDSGVRMNLEEVKAAPFN